MGRLLFVKAYFNMKDRIVNISFFEDRRQRTEGRERRTEDSKRESPLMEETLITANINISEN